MTLISGELYDGKTSAHWQASLSVFDGGLLQLQWVDGKADYTLGTIDVSSRLGNTPRYFNLPDGRKFETLDNDAVDALLRHYSSNELHGWQAMLHKLESSMHYVLLSLVVVIAFSWGMLKYGLPAAAETIAYALPQNIMQSATETTLEVLDDNYLKPTELDDEVQQRIKNRFVAMTRKVEQGFNYQLLFRKGGKLLGANAFALPSGTVVVTDELVNIASNDDEIASVLAHELGHVVHRHSLRQVLQNSAISLVVTYTTGDVSSLVVALPVLFVQLGYSRSFEHEADQFAYDFMQKNEMPLQAFANIMEGLEAAHMHRRSEAEENSQEEGSRVIEIFEYLSTHPPTEERVMRFRESKEVPVNQ